MTSKREAKSEVTTTEAKGKKFVVIGCYVFCTDEIQHVVLQKCYDDWGGIKVFLKNGDYFEIRIAPKEYRELPDLLNKF